MAQHTANKVLAWPRALLPVGVRGVLGCEARLLGLLALPLFSVLGCEARLLGLLALLLLGRLALLLFGAPTVLLCAACVSGLLTLQNSARRRVRRAWAMASLLLSYSSRS